jgi:hypothetical protein
VVRDLGLLETTGGVREIEWDAKDGNGRGVASGVYFVRVEDSGRSREAKFVLVR